MISGARLRDVFPAIGDINVTEIKAHTLVIAVQPVQARGALETVRRLEKPQKKNMPGIRPDQLPQVMQTMRTASISVSTRCLFMWQLLTITCPAEAAEARWEEVDIEARE